MTQESGLLKVGIVGTGYIAEFHAKAIKVTNGVELVGVADPNSGVAQAFASTWGVSAYDSLAAMAAAHQLDAIHLLVPPDLHYRLAGEALAIGLHVLVEKPMCTTPEEAKNLVKRGQELGLLVRVNHSMVFGESYVRLREYIRSGEIGPVDYLCLNHFAELGFIRFGPFGNWMLREPGNALLEIGSHPVSGMIDLVGAPDTLEVTADRDVILPGGARAYRRWRIHATAGRTAVDINLDLGPGFGQRTVVARGALGTVLADLDADTCMIDRRTRSGIDLDRYHRSQSQAAQLQRQAKHALADYILSKVKLRARGNPYEKSILDSIAVFYAELQTKAPGDSRISAETGLAVIEACHKIVDAAALKPNTKLQPTVNPSVIKPTILVLGGTGFIGKRLIQHLLKQGCAVRAAGRSISQALLDLGSDRLEVVRADMRSEQELRRALEGIDTVYHLATTDAKTWPQYLEREIEPTRVLAEKCLELGIKRLIYTGTIDSYYAGAGAGTITENTPLDHKIERRNYYARAKAAGERLLMDLHRERGLPVVIARPGIVIGVGGNPFHWGVGSWRSEGVCEVWGEGANHLPFVLVDDVASGLARCMDVPGIEGRSYNLIDAPLMTAREYLDALRQSTGMNIDAHYRSIASFYAEDVSKWIVKVLVRHPDAERRPSYHDWESRTQKAFFDCRRTREELGWQPASTIEALKTMGIDGSLKAWLDARG